MQRPPSIVLFERLYLGSLMLWAVNTALFWSRTREIMAQNPQLQANPQVAAIVAPLMIASLVATVGVSLLFWFLVARRGSVAGKWLVVVTEALGALFALIAILRLVQGRTPNIAMC